MGGMEKRPGKRKLSPFGMTGMDAAKRGGMLDKPPGDPLAPDALFDALDAPVRKRGGRGTATTQPGSVMTAPEGLGG